MASAAGWVAAVIVGIFAIFHGHAHGTELPAGPERNALQHWICGGDRTAARLWHFNRIDSSLDMGTLGIAGGRVCGGPRGSKIFVAGDR